MTARDPWEGILDEDEKIIWQGRPDGKVTLGIAHFAGAAFGLLFAGFALVWMMLASMSGGFFWMFGLLHFAVGLGIAGGALFGPAFRRRHTWYTLTDQRAFVATDLPFMGRKLNSYPITSKTRLTYQDNDPATITFHTEFRTTKNGSRRIEIGFERIADGAKVYRLMRDTQERQTA